MQKAFGDALGRGGSPAMERVSWQVQQTGAVLEPCLDNAMGRLSRQDPDHPAWVQGRNLRPSQGRSGLSSWWQGQNSGSWWSTESWSQPAWSHSAGCVSAPTHRPQLSALRALPVTRPLGACLSLWRKGTGHVARLSEGWVGRQAEAWEDRGGESGSPRGKRSGPRLCTPRRGKRGSFPSWPTPH